MKSVTSLSKRVRVSLSLFTALVVLPLGSAFQSVQAKPKSSAPAWGYRAKSNSKAYKRNWRNSRRGNDRDYDRNRRDRRSNDRDYDRDRRSPDYNRDRDYIRNRRDR